jgi:hypothetical protein
VGDPWLSITLNLCHILHSVSHWPVLVYCFKLVEQCWHLLQCCLLTNSARSPHWDTVTCIVGTCWPRKHWQACQLTICKSLMQKSRTDVPAMAASILAQSMHHTTGITLWFITLPQSLQRKYSHHHIAADTAAVCTACIASQHH